MTRHRLQVPDGWRNAEPFYESAMSRVMTALRDPRALERLTRYYTRTSDYPGASFAQLGDPDPSTVSDRDLLAVTLYGAAISPSTVRALLEDGEVRDRVTALLDPDRLPVDLALQDVTPEVLAVMDELYLTVRALVPPRRDRYEANWSVAAKLCARKRPDLFPVREEATDRYLGLWPSRYQIDWQVYYAIMSDAQVRSRLARLVDRAAEGDEVDVGDPRQLLRHLDVLIWMHAPDRR